MVSALRKAGAVLLVLAALAWTCGALFLTYMLLIVVSTWGGGGWAVVAMGILAGAVGVLPLAILVKHGTGRLALAWGILLAGAFLLFGTCAVVILAQR